MKTKKILMTGATGFLGSNLLKSFIINGYQIAILKRKTSNLINIKSHLTEIELYDIENIDIDTVLKEIKPDIIVHCATDYGRKNIEPSSIIEANLILPLKLIELCERNNVKCFINTDTFLDKRINHYSLSKKQFKEWLATYSKNLICINIVLEHFYGAFDDKTKFVSYIIEKFLSNSPEIDLTLGEQKRDFIYIDDIVSAFNCVINNIDIMSNGVFDYEIGTNKQIRIRDFVEMIKGIIGNTTTRVNYGAIPYRENEIMESIVDTRKIIALGWTPRTLLHDGLKKTIELEKNI